MLKPLPRIYWDACAWIAFINREMPSASNNIKEPRYEMCRETLRCAERGEVEIATSAFTLAEVCKRSSDPSHPAINLAGFLTKDISC